MACIVPSGQNQPQKTRPSSTSAAITASDANAGRQHGVCAASQVAEQDQRVDAGRTTSAAGWALSRGSAGSTAPARRTAARRRSARPAGVAWHGRSAVGRLMPRPTPAAPASDSRILPSPTFSPLAMEPMSAGLWPSSSAPKASRATMSTPAATVVIVLHVFQLAAARAVGRSGSAWRRARRAAAS